jgi:type 1 glutamine amidotransferase
MLARRLAAVIALVLAAVLPPASAAAAGEDVPHILVFTGTFGFRHSSIAPSLAVYQQLAAAGAYTMEATEDPAAFTREALARADIMLWSNTTGETPFTAEQKAMIVDWWSCGGGFMGVHAGADTNYQWPEYQELVGAAFKSHPHSGNPLVDVPQLEPRVRIEDPAHPITQAWAGTSGFNLREEYYKWRLDPRDTQDVHVLLNLDETTTWPHVQLGNDPYYDDQPLEWVKSFRDSNRVWYTALGHYDQTYQRADWQEHFVAAVDWVAETAPDQDCLTAAGITG